MGIAESSARRRTGPRKQWRVPDVEVRAAGPRFMGESHVRRRHGGRDLRPVPTISERRAATWRVAILRHRLPRPALRLVRQATEASHDDLELQRGAVLRQCDAEPNDWDMV